MGEFVFLQGSPSNNKFYIVLSGEVAVLIGQKSVGDFGDDLQAKKSASRTPSRRRGPKILINRCQDESKQTPGSTGGNSLKENLLSIPRGNGRSSDTKSSFSRSRQRESESLSNQPSEREISNSKDEQNSFLSLESRKSGPNSARGSSWGTQRMRVLVKMVTAVRGMQKKVVNKEPSPVLQSFEVKPHNNLKSTRTPSGGIKKMRALVRMVTAVRGLQKAAGTKQNSVKANDITEAEVMNFDDNDDEEEELDPLDEEQRKKFEEYALKFGQIIRYLEKGEAFGELALKKDKARSASILCKKDCEFLVLDKQQFEAFFGVVFKENEEFLRNVFPTFNTSMLSSENFNYLAYCFKVGQILKAY